MAHLLSIGTALPAHAVRQDEVMAILADALGQAPPARLTAILGNTGIEQRHIAMEPSFYFAPRQWSQRAAVYAEVGLALFETATRAALEKAALTPADIGTIVFISTTGTQTPSIPSRALERMGFGPDTRTFPLFGWGCAGGVLGLALAATLADPSEKAVLLVSVELCSLAYDHARMDKKDMIALALFSDGAAAAVVAGGAGPNRLGPFAQHIWPDTIDMMGWSVGDSGFDLVLARDIPAFVASDFAPFCDGFLAAQGLDRAELAEPACHPGGGRVVEALGEYFAQDLAITREVLRANGNMSSPTVLFVLDAVLAQQPTSPVVVTALGPGFTGAVGLVTP